MAKAAKAAGPRVAVTSGSPRRAKPPAGRPTAPRPKGAPNVSRETFPGQPVPGQPQNVPKPPADSWGARISGLLSDPKIWWGLGIAVGGYVAWKLYSGMAGSGAGTTAAATPAAAATTDPGATTPGAPLTPTVTSSNGGAGAVGGGGSTGNPGSVGTVGGGGGPMQTGGLVTITGGGGPSKVKNAASPRGTKTAKASSKTITRSKAVAQLPAAFRPLKTPTAAQARRTEATIKKVAPMFYMAPPKAKAKAAPKAKVKTPAKTVGRTVSHAGVRR